MDAIERGTDLFSDFSPFLSVAAPRFDQSTFWGRLRYFLTVTDPRTLLVDDQRLEKSKHIVEAYEHNRRLPPGLKVEALWRAQDGTCLLLPALVFISTPRNCWSIRWSLKVLPRGTTVDTSWGASISCLAHFICSFFQDICG